MKEVKASLQVSSCESLLWITSQEEKASEGLEEKKKWYYCKINVQNSDQWALYWQLSLHQEFSGT